MSVVINTNYAATVAANNLSASNAKLQTSLNRLSSGSRIVSPADDAGGLAVSMNLTATSKSQAASLNILGNGVSFLQTQDGALKVAGDILTRMQELGTMASDPTKSATDISNYDTEFNALKTQLTGIGSNTFNGKALFGTGSTLSAAGVSLTQSAFSTAIAGITSASTASAGGTAAATALTTIATERAQNGAEQSSLNFASQMLTANQTNLQAANSRIIDVDVAAESTQLARWNILVQSGTAMLAQANQSAQSALKLIG